MIPGNNQQGNQFNQYNSQYGSSYDNSYNSPYGNSYDNTGYGSFDQQQSRAIQTDSSQLISDQTYNLTLGGMLLYGFLINALMIKFFGEASIDMVSSGLQFLIVYFVMIFAGWALIRKSDSTVMNFIGYNLVVIAIGVCVASVVDVYIAFGYSQIISTAFFATAAITFAMMVVSNVIPNVFLSMGGVLSVALILTIIADFVLYVAGVFTGAIDFIVLGIFVLYVGYDWAKANDARKTTRNAIYYACELYLDMINIFLRLIRILSRVNSR